MTAGTVTQYALPEEVSVTAPRPVAFDITEVYETNFRYVWRCLRSLGVQDAQLDDALQDVFIVVQRRLSQFDGRAELTTWLYAIALRIARKYRNHARCDGLALTETTDRDEVPAPQADLETALHCSERLLIARAALNALNDEKREVFVLAQVEQRSAPEIAEIVRAPVNTVYSRLRAARQEFAAEVERLQAQKKRKLR